MRRRKKQQVEAAGAEASAAPDPAGGSEATVGRAADGPRANGPWDGSERAVDEDDPSLIDLGSLVVPGGDPAVEVRLQVDESSEQVIAVMLVSQDGAIELRPFAAPRNEDTWEEIRPRLAADAAQRGGTATPVDGPFGPALQLVLTGTDSEGRTVTQRSVVWGISGPRWLLRATAFGRPVEDYQEDGALERALRDVIVVRGNQPMPPGDALPLKLPANARRASG
jgi:hypothetical protein